ncbi:MAG: hypothetical protein ACI4BB_09225 [Coprococcus sp.]
MTALTAFLKWTAWPMTIPSLYGLFHLVSFFTGTALAVLTAWLLRSPDSLHRFNRILAAAGLILMTGELYKQLMNYFVVNEQFFDWWIFPFQLCSLPMYLCPLLPLIHNPKRHRILCTFLLDFNMMGAIATFIDPSGIFHSYWTLTLHGIIWHLILIFIGFFILFSHQADLTHQGFLSTLPLFAVFCVIAEMLNALLHSHGNINLFYISPWEMSTQLIFGDIDRLLGRPAGICIYILAMIAGALLIHQLAVLIASKLDAKKG